MASVKTVQGLALASMKTRNGLVSASVKTINGLDSSAGSPVPEILWWKMNDGSGTTITATVGPNGSTNAAWGTGPGGVGVALDFNGTTHESHSVSSVTYGSNIATFCFWINRDTTSGTQALIESSASASANANSFIIFLNGVLEFAFVGSAGLYTQKNITLTGSGTWHHYAIVFDGTTNVGTYVVYEDSVSQTVNDEGLNNRDNTGNISVQTLYVGARNTSSLFYPGLMDDVRIYNRALSAAEVLSVYNDPQ